MELYILNKSLEVEGMIDDAESVLWDKKYNDIGECEIYSPYSDELRELLKKGNYIFRYDDDMACIIEDVEITTDAEDGDYIIATAKDACTILSGRIVRWPFVYSGKVSDFIGKLLDENIVNPAQTARKISQFVVIKSNFDSLSATIEASTNTGDILDLIIATCKSSGYGFRVSIDLQGERLIFKLYEGIKRAYSDSETYVEFSPEFSNILETSYKESDSNYKNVAYVGYKNAYDDFDLKSVYLGSSEPDGDDRKEIYIDGTGTSREITLEELQLIFPDVYRSENTYQIVVGTEVVVVATVEATNDGEKITVTDYTYLKIIEVIGKKALYEHTKTKEFSGSVDTVDTYAYKTDYNIGDIVMAANKFGISSPARIVEVMESEDNEDGYQVEPKFEYLD